MYSSISVHAPRSSTYQSLTSSERRGFNLFSAEFNGAGIMAVGCLVDYDWTHVFFQKTYRHVFKLAVL